MKKILISLIAFDIVLILVILFFTFFYIGIPEGNSMDIGKTLVYRYPDVKNINPGDVIVYQTNLMPGEFLVAHRVIEKTDTGFVVKGDNNPENDKEIVNKEMIKGVVVI